MDLKKAAQRAGMRGRTIARELGVSDNAVSLWLRRIRPVPDARKRELAALIGVTVDDLLPPIKRKRNARHHDKD